MINGADALGKLYGKALQECGYTEQAALTSTVVLFCL